MCGICGVLRRDAEPVAPETIASMVEMLRHRGPDGDGCYFRPGIAFGFTRLAIIDLTAASDQPIIDDATGVALVFNGEIYNYIELRAELRELGHTFKSEGDGEVILRSYLEWGTSCLQRFNGMFAFAIWDGRSGQLLLARDRFGEKPLFYARSAGNVIFASEMKAILAARPELRQPNLRAVYRYLARGDLNLDDESFFQGIESLPAAHYLLLDRELRGAPRRYWEPSAAGGVPLKRADAIEGFRELVFDAIRLRLRADVPIGSSLSGGIDSSSIVSTIDALKANQEIQQRTFSARFHSRAHDEGRYIREVTAGAEAHETWVEPDAFVEQFARMQWHQEEPIASTSPFAQYCVMRLARERGTTVLLDGQGADEAMAGYDQAHGIVWAHWLSRGRLDRLGVELAAYAKRYHEEPWRPALFATYYLLPQAARDRIAARYYGSNAVMAGELRDRFAPAPVESIEPVVDRQRNQLVRWQLVTQLPEFLRYADRNSMAFSREVRLPFLDHRLVEYCFALPAGLLLNGATTKVVLREAMRGIVPDVILERKDKLAYSPPQARWLRGPLKRWMDGLIADAGRRRDVFDRDGLRGLGDHLRSERSMALAWRVASTEAWFQQMIDRRHSTATNGRTPVPTAVSW
jgi:asparagine synthase (glutamine-hydrolysing)